MNFVNYKRNIDEPQQASREMSHVSSSNRYKVKILKPKL